MPLLLPSYLSQWKELCIECGDRTGVDGALLLAILDRESAGGTTLRPPGPAGTGDHGSGLGLMQIDRRYHQEFAERPMPDGSLAWQNPRENILYAARYLFGLIARAKSEGVGVAAYNAGPQAIKAAQALPPGTLEGERVRIADGFTTGSNYAGDVLARRAVYKRILFPPPQETT